MFFSAGSNFLPNGHSESEYTSAGIRAVSHIFANDEFWWKGEDIGWDKANAVYHFTKENGFQPETVTEAIDYRSGKKKKSQSYVKHEGYCPGFFSGPGTSLPFRLIHQIFFLNDTHLKR